MPHFVHDVAEGLLGEFTKVLIIAPHYPGAKYRETLPSGLEVHRVRYWIPENAQTIFYDASAVDQLQHSLLNRLKGLAYSLRILAKLFALRLNSRVILNPRWILPHGLLAVLVTRVFRKCRVVVGVHGADIFRLKFRFAILLKRFTLKNADAVVVNSELTRKECQTLCDRPYHIIPSGYDSHVFKPSPSNKPHKTASCHLKLLSVSRLSPEKGIQTIIQACSILRSDGIPIKLVIAGDGPDRTELESMTKNLGLEDIVRFVGWLDKKRLSKLYQDADLFVGSSRNSPSAPNEAFGNVYAEAMACGTPIIVPRSAGAACLVDNGINGIIVDQATQSAFVREIKRFYQDRAWASKLSAAAPKAVQSCSLDQTIFRYSKILNQKNRIDDA